ncbi:hypothetical protein ACP70R_007322 [Stipagrostis hirtigluma subsp. patula]
MAAAPAAALTQLHCPPLFAIPAPEREDEEVAERRDDGGCGHGAPREADCRALPQEHDSELAVEEVSTPSCSSPAGPAKWPVTSSSCRDSSASLANCR